MAPPHYCSKESVPGLRYWRGLFFLEPSVFKLVTSCCVVWQIFIQSALSIMVEGKCKAVLFSQKEEPTFTSTKSSGTSGLEEIRRQVMFFFFFGT